MRYIENLKKIFFSEDENIEMYAGFTGYRKNGISSSKENGIMNRNQAITNPNKNVLGICFLTDMEGYFKYIHPNFLNLFEGVENQFYETSIMEKYESLGSPSLLKYLVAMVQQGTSNSFLKNRFSEFTNKFHKLEWNMVYYRGLLYFSLAEKPITSLKMDPKMSPEQTLSKEIQKLYWKIEHAKMSHANQISNKKTGRDLGL